MKASISGITSLQTFTPFTGASSINDSLLQRTLQVNHPLLSFTGITDPLSSTELHCFSDHVVMGFRSELFRRPYILQDKF